MKKLITTTALATSLTLTGLSIAQAETETVETETKAVVTVETTVDKIENAENTAVSSDDLSTLEATGEALEELDLTDEDETNLSDEARAEIDALNGIISILIDARAIYDQASDMPDDNEMVRSVIKDLASEREAQLIALQQRVESIGGEADQFGEAVGTGHRAFAQVRTVFDDDTEVAIEEVLRGERYIVDEIGKTLVGDISAEGETILEALRDEVYADIKRLEDLDDEA